MMTALEIVLLLIGVICVAVSFIFFIKVDGQDKARNINVELSDRQKDDIKSQITAVFREQTDVLAQTVEDRTRDDLERLSNQKIKEFAEYSDTVLGEINKSHNEVMFLYDMLNEKNKEVHNTIRDMQKAVKQSAEADVPESKLQKPEGYSHEPVLSAESEPDIDAANVVLSEESVSETQDGTDSKRDAVLKRHKQGKSEIEIAKTLGIGVGEVKLVIDLFKGMK